MIAYSQGEYIIDIRNIYETPSLISITIHKGILYNLLISKQTNHKILLTSIPDNSYLGNNIIYGVAGNELISVFNRERVLNKNWAEKVKKLSLSDENKQILLNAKIDDNPILVLVSFKEF